MKERRRRREPGGGGGGRGRQGGEDNREGEDMEHLVKVLSVNGRVMWHPAQCEISTSLRYNDWGEGELK